MASTDLSCLTKKEDILSDEALIEKNAVEIVKQMQKLRGKEKAFGLFCIKFG
jgi:hypothetical protein